MMNYRYARNEARGENGISNKDQLFLDSFCIHSLFEKEKNVYFKAFLSLQCKYCALVCKNSTQ